MNGVDLARRVERRHEGGVVRTIADTRLLVGRNTRTALRRPNALISSLVTPTILLLLLVAVYGDGLDLPGGLAFVDLAGTAMPVQAAVFVAMTAAGSFTLDLEGGMIDRLRSLPIGRWSVLAGRAVEATLRMTVAALVVTAVAVALGLRFTAGVLPAVAFLVLVVAFGFAWTWWAVFAAVAFRNFQAVALTQMLSFFPLFFLSGAMVPVEGLPGWLQPFAEVNPLTPVTEALRALALGGPTREPVTLSIVWILVLVVGFGLPSLRLYNRIGR